MPNPLSPEDVSRHSRTITTSQDSGELAAAATALAGSGQMEPTLALARALRDENFLRNVDPAMGETAPVPNVLRIFRTLAEHPTEWSGRLCELLYREAAFRSEPARLNVLLGALAAVTPTTEKGAEVFQASTGEGYAQVTAPLLLANGSPRALAVFEELITGEAVEDYVKVDILHRALLPQRTRLEVIECCERILARELSEEVRNGLIETLFDHESRLWFGPAMQPPEPQAWETARTEALVKLRDFAESLLRGGLQPALEAAVRGTQKEIDEILRGRNR